MLSHLVWSLNESSCTFVREDLVSILYGKNVLILHPSFHNMIYTGRLVKLLKQSKAKVKVSPCVYILVVSNSRVGVHLHSQAREPAAMPKHTETLSPFLPKRVPDRELRAGALWGASHPLQVSCGEGPAYPPFMAPATTEHLRAPRMEFSSKWKWAEGKCKRTQ